MKKPFSGILIKRLVYVVVFFLAIILFMEFNGRLSDLHRKDIHRDESRNEIYELELTKQALQTMVAYATSEVAAEEWAREEGHLIRPGDVPVVPLPQANLTPTPSFLPTTIPVQVSNWEVWYALFFGD
jgi:hypothetical protein